MIKIKHKNTVFLAVILSIMALFFFVAISKKNTAIPKEDIVVEEAVEKSEPIGDIDTSQDKILGMEFPLDKVSERVNKKPFGILISPQKSPVSPERFSGYHTAIDLEIFPGEIGREVPVKAICEGEIVLKKSSVGYGGLVVQSCEIEGNAVTVIYGHLKLSSVGKSMGDKIGAGERLGLLGDAYSGETDGERKHLHLGIHKGKEINIAGYVKSKSALSGWIDPCQYICKAS